MIEFHLTTSQYVEMTHAITRRRLLVASAIAYGALWVIGWILFAIGGFDAWSDLGAPGLLVILATPVAALTASIRTSIISKRSAPKRFLAISGGARTLDIQCQVDNEKLIYHVVNIDKRSEVDLNAIKKVEEYKGFFFVRQTRKIGYMIPLNSETENMYNQIREIQSARKK